MQRMKFALFFLLFCVFGAGLDALGQDIAVYFPHNSARLETDETEKLTALLSLNRNTEGTWLLEGRSSSSGNTAYNDSLSLRRAEAVRDFLSVQGLPLPSIRITAVGETLARPTDTDSDRAVFVRFVPAVAAVSQETGRQPMLGSSVRVTVIDAVTRKPLAGTAFYLAQTVPFSVDGLPVSPSSDKSSGIRFSANGYQDSTVNIPSSPAQQTVELLPEGVWQKLVFQNIYFYPNTAEIVPESYRAMEQMLKQLNTRPGAQIQIRGHVNWPEPNPVTPKIEADLQELSDKRAHAVMNWLIKKGIPAGRLSVVGLGYSQMLFPKAVTEGQQAQNRRVEVLLMR